MRKQEERIRNKRKDDETTEIWDFFVCFVIFRLFRILSSSFKSQFHI
jgi:hypothetical protein